VEARVAPFQERLRELSAGKIEAVVVEANAETIMPVGMVGGEIL